MSGLRVLALVVVLHCKLFITRLGGSFGSSNGIALIARTIIYNLPGFLSGEVQNCVAKAICIVDGSQNLRARIAYWLQFVSHKGKKKIKSRWANIMTSGYHVDQIDFG